MTFPENFIFPDPVGTLTKGPVHMLEGGHHLRKAPTRPFLCEANNRLLYLGSSISDCAGVAVHVLWNGGNFLLILNGEAPKRFTRA